jgi:hypothetical protein
MPAGRRSLLTPALVAELAERVERGESIGTAAKNVGASPRHTNIETTRRIYAGDWREAEERNALVLRQLAGAGIGQ